MFRVQQSLTCFNDKLLSFCYSLNTSVTSNHGDSTSILVLDDVMGMWK